MNQTIMNSVPIQKLPYVLVISRMRCAGNSYNKLRYLQELTAVSELVVLADPSRDCPELKGVVQLSSLQQDADSSADPDADRAANSTVDALVRWDVQYRVLASISRLLESGKTNVSRPHVAGVIYMHADAFITCAFLRLLHAHPTCLLSTPSWHARVPMADVLQPNASETLGWNWLAETVPPLQRAAWTHDVAIGGADIWVVPAAYLPLFNQLAAPLGAQNVINELAVPSVFLRLQDAHAAPRLYLPCRGGPMKRIHPSADDTCGHKVNLLNSTEARVLLGIWRGIAQCWPAQPRHVEFWAGSIRAQDHLLRQRREAHKHR